MIAVAGTYLTNADGQTVWSIILGYIMAYALTSVHMEQLRVGKNQL